ncbi:MAG: DEAD/DEAH box helicase [Spirochaetes bacterium]|jgi:ATP-dependent RNA helicase RhlB|nr:DEAD/DEAH box helicase [Spirochaetota bacterium]
MQFSEFNLDPDLLRSIDELEFEQCTEVQKLTFENTFKKRDVIIQSKTGTGKTAAFLISIFQHFQTARESDEHFALIVVPTRELAIQIEKDAHAISQHMSYNIASFYGGVGYHKQEKALKDGVDLMIATPGRLIDFIKSKKICLDKVNYFVVDEADRMFDLGFSQDLNFLTSKLPKPENRRTIFLSATINSSVRRFADTFIPNPVEINLSSDTLMVEDVDHYVIHVSIHEKFNLLLGLLRLKNPSNAFIFTNTKQAAVNVAEKLRINGFNADYIIGDLPQAKRTQIISRIQNNDFQFLVATDVAARGIHVDNLDMVINYDLPEDPENYVHRVGRTARAGQTGVAYSFVCEKFVYGLEALETLLNIKIPIYWPEEEYFTDDSNMDYRSITRPERRRGRPGESSSRGRDSSRGSRNTKSSRNSQRPANTRDRKKDYSKKPVAAKASQKAARPVINKKSSTTKPATNKQTAIKKTIAPKRNQKLEKRLKIYQEKYGVNFKVTSPAKTENKSVISKITGTIGSLFKKKEEK